MGEPRNPSKQIDDSPVAFFVPVGNAVVQPAVCFTSVQLESTSPQPDDVKEPKSDKISACFSPDTRVRLPNAFDHATDPESDTNLCQSVQQVAEKTTLRNVRKTMSETDNNKKKHIYIYPSH